MPYSNPASYDEFMGRWSKRLAPRFVAFAGVDATERVLDVGCGTGMLARALLDAAPQREVGGVDPTATYVEHARRSMRFAAPDLSMPRLTCCCSPISL